MATIEEVVSALVEQTKAESVTWETVSWNISGTPDAWKSVGMNGYLLFLTPTELGLSEGNRLVTIGRGEEIWEISGLVSSTYNDHRSDRSEALSKVLKCLVGDGR